MRISRWQLRLTESEGGLTIENLSRHVTVEVMGHGALQPGAKCLSQLPVSARFGRLALQLRVQRMRPAFSDRLLQEGLSATLRTATDNELTYWLRILVNALQSAASAPDFLPKAAQATAEMIGLDLAAALAWRDGAWTVQAQFARAKLPVRSWRPSRSLLEKVVRQRAVVVRSKGWHGTPQDDSTEGVAAAVVAPLLSPRGELTGALYGVRYRQSAAPGDSVIDQLDKQLLELLAWGVSGGLARLEQERAAVAAEVRFEQFFTPQLARQLLTRHDLLEGRDAEVSILFSDVSGFSRISERLPPQRVVAWINELMSELSDCVAEQEGVLVDFAGDGLEAMFGAPADQPDHPHRAAQAALAMLERLPGLNARWEKELGEPIRLGVGINTGQAQVGNVGSRQKFKYGPLGATVNLASRTQGVTRQFCTPVIVTASTAARLAGGLPTRRLGRIRLANLAEAVEVFELRTDQAEGWPRLKQLYEQALAAAEERQFDQATRCLGELLATFPHDQPAILLLSLVVAARAAPGEKPPLVFDGTAR
jgi:adenylate cyclase